MKFDAIIFDMDGTLIDNVSPVTKSWNETIASYGINKILTEDDIQGIMGLTTMEIGKKFFPDMDSNKANEIVQKACHDEIDYFNQNGLGNCYIQDENLLKQLSSKYPLFIVSNCMEGYIEVFLDKFNYRSYFKDYKDTRNGLNKAENIQLLVQQYHLKRPVYVGDTQKDEQSCKEAKVFFMFASYGFGTSTSKYAIQQLSDLLYLEDL